MRSLRTAANDLFAAGGPRPSGAAPGSELVEILGMDAQFDVAQSACATPAGVCWNGAIVDWNNLLSAVEESEAAEPVNKVPSSVTVASRDVAIEDWDTLMSAVTERLRSSVAEPTLQTSRQQVECTPGFMRTSVLECLAALDHLHSALIHELSRCRQLKLEVVNAQSALAQARSDLRGTRAGERRARHMALHDGLTSLPNRTYFRERLEKALNASDLQRPSLALLYLDLDGFKAINDTHGHAAGDELLKIIAARLTRAVRGGDMVSRLGGDEFACLLAGSIGRQHLEHLASKVFDAVCAPMKIGRLELTVRPSIGIAVCPADGETADALLTNADAAMYHTKRHGLGRAFCDQMRTA